MIRINHRRKELSMACRSLLSICSFRSDGSEKFATRSGGSFTKACTEPDPLEMIFTSSLPLPRNILLFFPLMTNPRYFRDCFLLKTRSRISKESPMTIFSSTSMARYKTFSNTGDTYMAILFLWVLKFRFA